MRRTLNTLAAYAKNLSYDSRKGIYFYGVRLALFYYKTYTIYRKFFHMLYGEIEWELCYGPAPRSTMRNRLIGPLIGAATVRSADSISPCHVGSSIDVLRCSRKGPTPPDQVMVIVFFSAMEAFSMTIGAVERIPIVGSS